MWEFVPNTHAETYAFLIFEKKTPLNESKKEKGCAQKERNPERTGGAIRLFFFRGVHAAVVKKYTFYAIFPK